VEEPFLSAIKWAWVKVVRQTEIHTAEPPGPEPSAFEVKLDTEKLKRQITRY